MGSHGTETDSQPTADSNPEDVAVLYSWANLQGAKYRDYSASRREYRAQVRYRAAKALLERELKARMDAEAAATETERIALAAEATAYESSGGDSASTRSASPLSAEAATRKATADRAEAAHRAEAVAHAAVLALREQREIAEAHLSARRKAQLYEESKQRRRHLAGPQPRIPSGGTLTTPDELGSQNLKQVPEPDLQDSPVPPPGASASQPPFIEAPFDPTFGSDILGQMFPGPGALGLPSESATAQAGESDLGPAGPAWLYAPQTPPQARVLQSISPMPPADMVAGDTLQDSQEREQ